MHGKDKNLCILLAIFMVLGPSFEASLIISKKNPSLIALSSKFLHNIKTCICIRKCNKNEEFSPSDF